MNELELAIKAQEKRYREAMLRDTEELAIKAQEKRYREAMLRDTEEQAKKQAILAAQQRRLVTRMLTHQPQIETLCRMTEQGIITKEEARAYLTLGPTQEEPTP